MSSAPPSDTQPNRLTDDRDLNNDGTPAVSLATLKDRVGVGPSESARDVTHVAKYIALEHPGFVLAPALPSVFDLNFEHRELRPVEGQIEQATTFRVYYGEWPIQQFLGTVTVKRVYDDMPDTSRPLDGSGAVDASVEYSDASAL